MRAARKVAMQALHSRKARRDAESLARGREDCV
jgi:hypothetical protein